MTSPSISRKRGANYTNAEKALLLGFVMQYKNIVECKKTTGMFVRKKKEAWHAITVKYNNSNCTTGRRDAEQLKTLYDNMKQKSRKDHGESNKLAYINSGQQQTEADPPPAMKIVKEEKIETNKTGWEPTSDDDEKVLPVIVHIEPLANPYDSASVFFKDTAHTQETDDNIDVTPGYNPSIQELTDKAQERLTSECVPIIVEPPTQRKNLKCASKQRKIKKPVKTAEALKRLYFKKKCQNADLERKKLMMEMFHQKREHQLKMEILRMKRNIELN